MKTKGGNKCGDDRRGKREFMEENEDEDKF